MRDAVAVEREIFQLGQRARNYRAYDSVCSGVSDLVSIEPNRVQRRQGPVFEDACARSQCVRGIVSSRGWKRDALARTSPPAAAPLSPPPAESRKKLRGGLQAALAAAATPWS